MAAVLVVSLAVPDAFGAAGILFGGAYYVVRFSHLAVYAFTPSVTLPKRAVPP